MNIEIKHMIDGAKEAKGIVVIIDVFRAFSVEVYLANNNAYRIYPVGDKDIAYQYKKVNKEAILIGERKGVKLPNFDYGNSPSEIENIDFTGKEVVHTTSAGTQGIANAINADEIITGSLVNSKAIAKYIKDKNPENVTLVAMGIGGEADSDEDTLCAYYIKSLIEGKELDISESIKNLKKTSGAKFFKKELNTVFPKRDFYLCTETNKFNFILRVVKNSQGLDYVEKIEIN